MTAAPETRYVRLGDGTNLAYQQSGAGPLDLVWMGTGIPIDLLWEDPGFIRLSKRLGRFSRTIWWESRGFGASEGNRFSETGEPAGDDLIAVLNTVGCDKVTLVGWNGAGGGAIEFLLSHPQRVSELVLINTYALYLREDDYPWGIPADLLDRIVENVREGWSAGTALEVLVPGRSTDERFRTWWARSGRLAMGPEQTAEYVRASFTRDLRPVLSSISVPTLVLHREGDRFIHVGAGRYLADHIPGAKFVVLPEDEHLYLAGNVDALVDEIEEFLTGGRSGAEADVATTTVLFTDIVSSTEQQARVGRREWSRITDQHEAIVRSALDRHRGREVRSTGDGVLATFEATGSALRCAVDMVKNANSISLKLRAGVHTGEVELRGDDIDGLAVNIARRVCDIARPDEVLVTRTVTDLLVASGFEFEDREEHELKGVPGSWQLFAVRG